VVGGASLALALAFPAFAARTVSSDYTLSGDEDWRGDGVVTVEKGVNVDLNGNTLWLAGLAGEGAFSTSVADASFTDLTDSSKADANTTTTTNGIAVVNDGSQYDGAKLFKGLTYSTGNRILVGTQYLPYAVTYDFGEAAAVNSYKIRMGTNTADRGPAAWTLEGSVDGSSWTSLDAQSGQSGWSANEYRPFVFASATAYRYYRITFTGVVKGNYLGLLQLQYGHIGNQIRIDSSQSAGFAAASNTVDSAIDCVLTGGTLPADIDLRGLNRKITLDGNLDLAGRRVFVPAIDGKGTLSSSKTAFADLTGSGEASASRAVANAKYPPSNAFDNNLNTFGYWTGFSPSANTVAINYDFGNETNVNRYTMYYAIYNSRHPKSWVFSGSNDNSAWTVLDEQINKVMHNDETRTIDFVNETAYRYYRLHITDCDGSKLNVYELEYGVGGDNNGIVVAADGIADSDTSSITVSSGNGVAIGDFTLADNLDTTAYGAYSILGTIDLAGHDLTVSKLAGPGTVTDSSTSATGTLHVVVASGAVANATVSLTGNLKLSKEGAGTLTATKAAQTYAGGTEVVAGTLGCGNTGANSPFGTGAVTVDAGGVLEMNGKGGHNITPIVLNGGTLQNSTSVTKADSDELGLLTLTADSTFNCADHTWFGDTGDSGLSPCIDLGGYTLTVDLNSSKTLRLRNVAITNGGTLDVINGGRILVIGYGVTAPTVTLKAQCAVLIDSGASMSVKDYESLYASDYDAATYTGPLSVYGTFIPTTRYFLGCTLMDGATLDLSALSDTLSISSLATTAGQTELSFADDATIYVNVGSRSLTSSSCLLSWTEETKPSNLSSLKFVRPDDTRIYCISVQSGGLYYAGAGLMIIFR